MNPTCIHLGSSLGEWALFFLVTFLAGWAFGLGWRVANKLP